MSACCEKYPECECSLAKVLGLLCCPFCGEEPVIESFKELEEMEARPSYAGETIYCINSDCGAEMKEYERRPDLDGHVKVGKAEIRLSLAKAWNKRYSLSVLEFSTGEMWLSKAILSVYKSFHVSFVVYINLIT